MPQESSMKIAFVGGGGTTAEHLRAFAACENTELVGIANRTLSKAQELAKPFNIPCVTDDIGAMITQSQPDLVVMAVYETAIKATLETILDYPVAVLIEKPVGLDYAQALEIQALATAKDRQVWVGLNRRHLAATRAVLSDIDSRPDEMRYVHIHDQQSLETARIIGHDPSVVDTWMYANSIHLSDYALAFCRGEVQDVKILSPWKPDNPELVLASIHFDSGDVAVYQALWAGPGPWACSVATAGRRWDLRPLEQAMYQNAGERSLNSVDADALDQDFKPGFKRQAEEVIKALTGKTSSAVPLSEAIRSTKLVHQIYGV